MLFQRVLSAQSAALVLLSHRPLASLQTLIPASEPVEPAPAEVVHLPESELAKRARERRERMATISDSMLTYLKGVQERDKVLEKDRQIFEQGKRHLANMMGLAAEQMTEEEIDRSIRYLFPSGLSMSSARPIMKSPDHFIAKYKKMTDELSKTGWPQHTLFYTFSPKYYSLLSDINRRTVKLVKEYDARQLTRQRGGLMATAGQNREGTAEEHPMLTKHGRWLTMEQLTAIVGKEIITKEMYAHAIMALEYLAQLPNASREANFIGRYYQGVFTGGSGQQDEAGHKDIGDKQHPHWPNWIFRSRIPNLEKDPETGRTRATSICAVKATKMEVTVLDNGSGRIEVDGQHYSEFRSIMAREIILSPLVVTGLLGKVDVKAKLVDGLGGMSVIPRALRHGIGLGIAALYPDKMEPLRLAGLLTSDPRKREREKINHKGARAKWRWLKR